MHVQSTTRISRRYLLGALLAPFILAGTAFSAFVPQITGVTIFSARMTTPVSAASDGSGNFYVADQRGGGIVKLGPDGRYLAVMATTAPPVAVAVSPTGTIAASLGDSVVLLDQTGKVTAQLGAGPGEFGMAAGITFDDAGKVYVTDGVRNCVAAYTAAGALVSRFGSSGTAGGQFSMPTGIAFEKVSQQLAVADTFNGRIQFFTLAGAYVKSIGAFGSGPLLFTSPQGIAFEYAGSPAALSRAYIVDSFQSNIQAIDPTGTGTFLSMIGSYGTEPGQLLVPTGVLFDGTRSRLVAVNGFGNLTLYAIDATSTPPAGTPPVVRITAPPATTTTSSITLSGTTSAGASVSVRNDTTGVTGTATVTGTTWSYAAVIVPGTNSFTVTASNSAGSTAATTSITYNAAVGVTVAPPPAFIVTKTLTISGTMDSGAAVTVAVTSGTSGTVSYPTATTWQAQLSGLSDGITTVTVTATRGGNSATATALVTVDTTPPAVVLSALSSGSATSDQVQNISGTVTDAHPGVVTVNGKQATVLADGSFSSLMVLVPGSNAVTVSATDAAGNATTKTMAITFVPNGTRIAVTEPADGARVTSPLVTFQGTVDRAATVTAGGVAAPVSGGAWSAQVNLSPGINTIEVVATEAGGAVIRTKRTIFLDPLPADLEVSSPAQDAALNGGISVTVRTSTSGSIGYTFNGAAGSAAVSGGIATFPLAFTGEGAYPLTVSTTDQSGNTVITTRNFLFDTTAPSFTLSQASGVPTSLSGTVEPGATVTVYDKNGTAGTATVSGGSWTAPLTAGYDPVSLVAAATDAAGNTTVRALNPALPDGDMNGDGVVTAADALIALKIYMGFLKPTGKDLALYLAHGDVAPLAGTKPNPNGVIDLADALLILRRAVGQTTW